MKQNHLLKKKLAKGLLGALCLFSTFLFCFANTKAAEKSDLAEVEDITYTKAYKDDSGREAGQYVHHLPKLAGESLAVKKINGFYKKQYKSQLKIFKEEYQEFTGEGYQVTGELNFKVTYNKNGLLSILQTGYLYTGGAHGMPYRIAHTFDLNTGGEITLKDLFTLDNTAMKKKIARAFQKKIRGDKASYWKDAEKTVKNNKGLKSDFYLTKKGIRFYYDPYSLASYAQGFVEATLHYTSNQEVLKVKNLES